MLDIYYIFYCIMLNYQKIIDLMKKEKLSMRALADILGMTGTGLGDSINNKTLKVDTLEKIANRFGLPVAYFFDEMELINSPNTVSKDDYYKLMDKYNKCLEEKDGLMKSDSEIKVSNKRTISK